ncbi:MAG TPA: HNH endonuclease [Archangium sp.]|uniref:HNH endonuclease n=1 Tax=Archangium sp. TaxID=1872627 RepID=UPI002E32FDFB|nr:HNH endonuclease [Archangium sp.]HEX5753043.1 HNH endonuclease [Archangium sp.]
MRPVERGNSPQAHDYENYRDAFPGLVSRLGAYCTYCERRIPTMLAVEHIQPKGLPQYAALIGQWDNFLLGCVNCNSTKKDQDVSLEHVLLPDRDNTAAAFAYTSGGEVVPAHGLTAAQQQMAAHTLALCGLDKGPSEVTDENGRIVAIDRYAQRMEVWGQALTSKADLAQSPTEGMRRMIVKLAQATGFFSIWMQVFDDDVQMRRMLIDGFTREGHFFGFPGTARSCFDANTRPVTPRPANGLAHGSKS